MSVTEPNDQPPIALDALKQMLGGDDDLVKMILEKFRAEIAGDISQLRELGSRGEPEPIRALAHRLKGTCGNTQAMGLSNIAKSLQFAMAAGDIAEAPGLISALELERVALEQYLSDSGY